jgi:hypothetical protein
MFGDRIQCPYQTRIKVLLSLCLFLVASYWPVSFVIILAKRFRNRINGVIVFVRTIACCKLRRSLYSPNSGSKRAHISTLVKVRMPWKQIYSGFARFVVTWTEDGNKLLMKLQLSVICEHDGIFDPVRVMKKFCCYCGVIGLNNEISSSLQLRIITLKYCIQYTVLCIEVYNLQEKQGDKSD